jgi:teichuronic acid exporter
MSLKKKTLHAFKWSFIDISARYGVQFFIAIILARLLNPTEFGIAGMASIFIALSSVFVDGGMGDSLIRRKKTNEKDYNSIFFFNLVISIVIYTVLYLSSPFIAIFFDEHELTLVIKVASMGLVINSLAIVQIAILRRKLEFKRQAMISFTGTLVGGISSVIMAYLGYSYWSLIIPSIITALITTSLVTITSSWKPKLFFDINIIRDHFRFGFNIMVGSFITVIHQRIYHAFIGKNFSMGDLGYYYKADNLQKLPSANLSTLVRHVTYPILATMQDDKDQLKKSYETLIKYTTLLSSLAMFLLGALAESVVLVLYGEKWLQSVPYLQLLCIVGLILPIISINTNIVNVKGRSDIFLYLTLLNIFLSIPIMALGYFYGIKIMIVGMILASVLRYSLVLYITRWLINYSVLQQLADVAKPIVFAALVVSVVFIGNVFLQQHSPYTKLVVLVPLFLLVLMTVGRLSRFNEYIQLESIALKRLSKHK